MNKRFGKIFSVVLIFSILFVNTICFAAPKSIDFNGVSAYKYSSKSVAMEEMSDPVVVYYGNDTYYVERDEKEEWEAGYKEEKKSENDKALDKSLSNVLEDSKDKINQYGEVMKELQPDPIKGWGLLGDSVKGGLNTALSVGIILFWIIYIIVLIWNGVNVLIEGMYDRTQTPKENENVATNLGRRFISKNTENAVNDTADNSKGKWIKNELKRMALFILITVGLTSGLFFNILGFIAGLINPGGTP